jgi:hypothetical protein
LAALTELAAGLAGQFFDGESGDRPLVLGERGVVVGGEAVDAVVRDGGKRPQAVLADPAVRMQVRPGAARTPPDVLTAGTDHQPGEVQQPAGGGLVCMRQFALRPVDE